MKEECCIQKKCIALIATIIIITCFFVRADWANIPAPPANQLLTIVEGTSSNLSEAKCRACHDDPNIVEGPSNVDRHHLLYGTPIQEGACSVNETDCLFRDNCDPTTCEFGPFFSCRIDAGRPDIARREASGEVGVGKTAIAGLNAKNDVISDTEYACLSCHRESTVGGTITFLVEKDCLKCHIQLPGEAHVHHLSATAQ